ncbi:MAG: ABC transporter ATP-binding protein [Gammaproteobacteria bacterium]|nr:ABC transporter ATP-binding protein [Gammaproteobacteria bacterium]MCP4475674.1 ABC transporter ATP-binding protein [Gammaproteobacteria bacterium]
MAYIQLNKVSVEFPIYGINARSLKLQMLSRLTPGGRLKKNSKQRTIIVKALDNVSFSAEKGDRIGLVGYNGAGKSTLLRLLANIYEPMSGSIEIQGKTSTLFHASLAIPDATGEENIVFGSLIQGATRKATKKHIKEISSFAELGDYIKMPARTYSSGMQIRLGFAIATSFHPQILLIDEVIGVGDRYFIDKAEQRMEDLIYQADIVFLASHNKNIITQMCNKVMLMDHGQLKYFGDIEEGLELYEQLDDGSNGSKKTR